MPALRCGFNRFLRPGHPAVEAQARGDVDQQRLLSLPRIDHEAHILDVEADRSDLVVQDAGIGGVSDVAPDVAGEPEDAAAPVRVGLIQMGAEADPAARRRQSDDQCFRIQKSDGEKPRCGATLQAVRIGRQIHCQRTALFIGEAEFLQDRWAAAIGRQFPGLLVPALSQAHREVVVRAEHQKPCAALAERDLPQVDAVFQ